MIFAWPHQYEFILAFGMSMMTVRRCKVFCLAQDEGWTDFYYILTTTA
jgi:hypothetical protein